MGWLSTFSKLRSPRNLKIAATPALPLPRAGIVVKIPLDGRIFPAGGGESW
jgi:hypothetical protein